MQRFDARQHKRVQLDEMVASGEYDHLPAVQAALARTLPGERQVMTRINQQRQVIARPQTQTRTRTQLPTPAPVITSHSRTHSNFDVFVDDEPTAAASHGVIVHATHCDVV